MGGAAATCTAPENPHAIQQKARINHFLSLSMIPSVRYNIQKSSLKQVLDTKTISSIRLYVNRFIPPEQEARRQGPAAISAIKWR